MGEKHYIGKKQKLMINKSKKTWESPKLLNLDNSQTTSGTILGNESRAHSIHTSPSHMTAIGTEFSLS